MKIKLAEALLRRKELQEKVDQLRTLDQKELYEVKVNRQQVSENIDNITAAVPRITFDEFTKAYDFHAKRLRLVDALIQQTNWVTEVDVDDTLMDDYKG